MVSKEQQQQLATEFERNRAQLMNVSAQKQQLQFQSDTLGSALEELAKTGEKKVYKAVGNILVLSEVDKVKKELSEEKETSDLRVKSLLKQEENIVAKLNRIKAQIEGKTEAKETASSDIS
ncbi:MAG: prefoldin subunit [Candidatus Diapherotrites archaeon]|nr:prefoldin subunit [Candidatus Diapherotrites archaeon]